MGNAHHKKAFKTGQEGQLAHAVRRDSATVDGAADGAIVPLSTDASGNLRVAATIAASSADVAAITSPATSSSSANTLLASNTSRVAFSAQNNAAVVLYLKLGSTASATDFTVAIPANGFYECPWTYTGIVTARLASGADSTAAVTEMT